MPKPSATIHGKEKIARTECEKDIPKLVESLRSGKSLYQSMIDAGYAESSAKNGYRVLPDAAIELMAQKGVVFSRLGRHFNSSQRADMIRGALVENVMNGEDKAVRSLELLGRDIEVGIFRPEQNTTAVQINFPAGLAELMGMKSE